MTPTLPASEALESQSYASGCRETTSPSCIDVSGAVLVPPTGNGVLNQIPAGDGRESSREQVVLDDGAPILRRHLSRGRETMSPGWCASGIGGRAASLTHKKKKKKKKTKWREAEGGVMWKWKLHTGSEVEAMRTQWNRSGSEEEIVECAGQRVISGTRIC